MRVHLTRLLLVLAPLLAPRIGAAEGHHHHLSLSGAATTHDGHTFGAVGADYEYRFSGAGGYLGLGALVDQAFSEHPHTIVGVPLTIHPVAGFKVLVAPGVETDGSETHYLTRVGAGYDFSLPAHFTIGPSASFDIVGTSVAWVYGLALGFGI